MRTEADIDVLVRTIQPTTVRVVVGDGHTIALEDGSRSAIRLTLPQAKFSTGKIATEKRALHEIASMSKRWKLYAESLG
jgi:hypothetical protein